MGLGKELRVALAAVLAGMVNLGVTANAAEYTAYIYGNGDQLGEIDTEDVGDLARAVQNPVADLISLPFQYNANFEFGPRERTQHQMNIQPVIPFDVSDEWLLITRSILPVVSQPSLFPGDGGRQNGLGDATVSTFFSPKDRSRWLGGGRVLWGAGPAVLLPTSTDDRLGPGEWGAGPSAVFLTMPGRWVIGSLFSQVWSFTDDGDEDEVSLFSWQPFVNYNFDGGWYLASSPLITANWEADDEWTVPIGGGGGRVMRIGGAPVNISVQAFYNVAKPDNIGPDWSMRFQLQLLFPQ